MAPGDQQHQSGGFFAGVAVTLLVGWFLAYNFLGFRIEGISTGDFFPDRAAPAPAEPGVANSTAPLDADPIDGDRADAIDALVASCATSGGSAGDCECVASFLVDNTSRDEMVFADEAPSTGDWMYFGGNMWVPGKYRPAFAACGSGG